MACSSASTSMRRSASVGTTRIARLGKPARAAALEEREVGRPGGVDGAGGGVADVVEDGVEVVAFGPAHRVVEVAGRGVGARGDEVDGEVEDVVAEGAHLDGVRFEGDR